MSDVKKIATRETYGKTLVELGAEMPNLVVLDADLAGATKTGVFKKAYPDRHIDCGIAESNMMSIAAGLAASGMVPFASTFAMFAAGRAFEQVRNSIGYPHLNVKIGATHAGISVGEDGASHQCLEDLALMRTIPGMVVMCPADDTEARLAMKAAVEHDGPVYIRFGRAPVPVVFGDDYKFEIGKGSVIREGKDVSIIANGLCVASALEAAEMLAKDGIDAEVVNICTIKPLDEELAVRTGNRSHGHNAAGLVPDLLEEFTLFGEEIAGIVLLCCYDKTVLALNGDFGHGVAFVQVRNNFLCNVHIFCPFISESDVPFKTITKTIAQTYIYLQKQSKARSKKNKNCVFKNNPGKVVTAEEHNIIGGLGGAVAECLAEKCPTKMYRIGVRDKFGESGSAAGVLI